MPKQWALERGAHITSGGLKDALFPHFRNETDRLRLHPSHLQLVSFRNHRIPRAPTVDGRNGRTVHPSHTVHVNFPPAPVRHFY